MISELAILTTTQQPMLCKLVFCFFLFAFEEVDALIVAVLHLPSFSSSSSSFVFFCFLFIYLLLLLRLLNLPSSSSFSSKSSLSPLFVLFFFLFIFLLRLLLLLSLAHWVAVVNCHVSSHFNFSRPIFSAKSLSLFKSCSSQMFLIHSFLFLYQNLVFLQLDCMGLASSAKFGVGFFNDQITFLPPASFNHPLFCSKT